MAGIAPGGISIPQVELDPTIAKKKTPLGIAPGGAGTTITPTTATTSPSLPSGPIQALPGGIAPSGGGYVGPAQPVAPAAGGIAPSDPAPTVSVGGQTVTSPVGGLPTTGAGLPSHSPGTVTPTATPAPPAQTTLPAGVTALPGGVLPINPGMMPSSAPPAAVGPGTTPIGSGMSPTPTPPMPGPGPQPIPPGSWPVAPENPYMTGFSPGNDLRFQQINPYGNDRLQRTQGAVDAATNALSGGPNRQQMAQDLFQSYLQQSAPEYDRMIREITQRNAAGGRLGSGMYGSNLVDATTQRGRDIAAYGTQLAYDTTAGDIQDRLNNVSALSGLENQQFGQGLTQRNELRGERGYQYGVGQQAQQDAINQRLLEDQLLNSASNRDLSYYQTLGQFGFGGNPSGTLGGLAGDTQNAATGAGAGVNDLFMQWLLSQQAGG